MKKCQFKPKSRYRPDNILECDTTGKCKLIDGKTKQVIKPKRKILSKLLDNGVQKKQRIVEKVFNRVVIIGGQHKTRNKTLQDKYDKRYRIFLKMERTQTDKNKILSNIKKMYKRYSIPLTGNMYLEPEERQRIHKLLEKHLKAAIKELSPKTPKKKVKSKGKSKVKSKKESKKGSKGTKMGHKKLAKAPAKKPVKKPEKKPVKKPPARKSLKSKIKSTPKTAKVPRGKKSAKFGTGSQLAAPPGAKNLGSKLVTELLTGLTKGEQLANSGSYNLNNPVRIPSLPRYARNISSWNGIKSLHL